MTTELRSGHAVGLHPRYRRKSLDAGQASRPMFYGFLAPAIALVAIFTVYPLVEGVQMMFQNNQGFGTPTLTGLANLQRLFADPAWWNATWNTLIYTAGTAGGTVIIGTALAIAFHQKIPFNKTLKFLVFLPVILPPTFFALAWQNALDPNLGWFNHIFGFIPGVAHENWLSNPQFALAIVIFNQTIQYVGIPMILMLSALNDIPESVTEAATLDGVNAWQRIWKITLPLSRDVLVVVIGLQIIGNFKALDGVYALTKGGPGLASDIFGTFIYRQGFQLSDFGYASAAAVISTIIIVGISMLYTFFFRPNKISNQ